MKIFILLAVAAAVPASARSWSQGPDPDLGSSVRANIFVQTIDPDPDYSNAAPLTTSGRRSADTIIRYETGKIKALLKVDGRVDLGKQGGAQDIPTVSIPLISSSPNN